MMMIEFVNLVRVAHDAGWSATPEQFVEKMVEAILDELGERVELKTYTGNGDFDIVRVWNIGDRTIYFDKGD